MCSQRVRRGHGYSTVCHSWQQMWGHLRVICKIHPHCRWCLPFHPHLVLVAVLQANMCVVAGVIFWKYNWITSLSWLNVFHHIFPAFCGAVQNVHPGVSSVWLDGSLPLTLSSVTLYCSLYFSCMPSFWFIDWKDPLIPQGLCTFFFICLTLTFL